MKSFLSLTIALLIAGTYCSPQQLNEKCENFQKQFQNSPPSSKSAEAQLGQLPHTAALIYYNEISKKYDTTRCTGSLISKKHVIAPAACDTPGITLKYVRLGVVSVPEEISGQDSKTDHSVKNITIHPEYNRQRSGTPNDIAIIELEKEVTFSDNIRPACLNTKNNRSDVVFSYWGKKDKHSNSWDLRTSTPTLEPDEECDKAYGVYYINYFPDKQMCVRRGSIPCERGPEVGLQASDGKLFVLVSIPSFGISSCHDYERPDVHTKIFKHLDWIEQIVFG